MTHREIILLILSQINIINFIELSEVFLLCLSYLKYVNIM